MRCHVSYLQQPPQNRQCLPASGQYGLSDVRLRCAGRCPVRNSETRAGLAAKASGTWVSRASVCLGEHRRFFSAGPSSESVQTCTIPLFSRAVFFFHATSFFVPTCYCTCYAYADNSVGLGSIIFYVHPSYVLPIWPRAGSAIHWWACRLRCAHQPISLPRRARKI